MEQTSAMVAADRTVLRIGGSGARGFLQGLVSNDLARLDRGAAYAALLTPQGKYLFDFFLVAEGSDVLLDVKSGIPDTYREVTGRELQPTIDFGDRLAKLSKELGDTARAFAGL